MEPRKSFLLRVGAPLWKEIERWAQDEFRSVNAQVEFLLRQAVLRRKAGPSSGGDSEALASAAEAAPPPRAAALEPESPGSDLEVGRQD